MSHGHYAMEMGSDCTVLQQKQRNRVQTEINFIKRPEAWRLPAILYLHDDCDAATRHELISYSIKVIVNLFMAQIGILVRIKFKASFTRYTTEVNDKGCTRLGSSRLIPCFLFYRNFVQLRHSLKWCLAYADFCFVWAFCKSVISSMHSHFLKQWFHSSSVSHLTSHHVRTVNSM